MTNNPYDPENPHQRAEPLQKLVHAAWFHERINAEADRKLNERANRIKDIYRDNRWIVKPEPKSYTVLVWLYIVAIALLSAGAWAILTTG